MNLKLQAAQKALEFVKNGMVVGLGTGSTTAHFIDLLGEKLRQGDLLEIRGVPTSELTANQARRLNIPLTTLGKCGDIDLAVDGADEVDPRLDLIKGLGKALLREKIVEIHARQFVVIVDETKLVQRLGMHVALPVELVPFEWEASMHWLNKLGCRAELWLQENGKPFVTDNGNYLARCWFEESGSGNLLGIPDPFALSDRLANRPGIVEHGLFLNMADKVIIAEQEGIRMVERAS